MNCCIIISVFTLWIALALVFLFTFQFLQRSVRSPRLLYVFPYCLCVMCVCVYTAAEVK